MLNKEKLSVSIGGTPLYPFRRLTVLQTINDHHRFELLLDVETGEEADVHTLDKSKDWIGKKVVIQFGGNPSRPFVLGSSFHGLSGAGGGINNNIKSLTTRSGNAIVFNDEKKSIDISDSAGSAINLFGDKTLAIGSTEKITLHSKEIEIIADKKVQIIGKKEVVVSGNKTTLDSTSETTIMSDKVVKTSAPIRGKTNKEM